MIAIERRGIARQAGEVALVAEFAAQHRVIDHVRIVDNRRNHRHLGLIARKAEVVDRARVEIAAVADAGQIELRNGFGRQRQE